MEEALKKMMKQKHSLELELKNLKELKEKAGGNRMQQNIYLARQRTVEAKLSTLDYCIGLLTVEKPEPEKTVKARRTK